MPVTKRQLQRTLDPDWVRAADVPHTALRYGETFIKRQLLSGEQRAVLDLALLYRQAMRDLESESRRLAAEYGTGRVPEGAAGRVWRNAFLAYATERMERLTDESAALSMRAASRAFLAGYYGRLWVTTIATQPDTPIKAARVNLMQAAGMLREDVFDDLIRLPEYAEWRMTYGVELEDLLLRVRRMIPRAMLDGESVESIMLKLRDLMGVPVEWEAYRFGTATVLSGTMANFHRLQTMVRTSVMDYSNAGALEIYKQNTDILSGYQWITARDERVCPTCLALANTVYNVNDVFRPPRHPNCRCTTIPVINPQWMLEPQDMPRISFGEFISAIGLENELAAYMQQPGNTGGRIG